MSRTLGLHEWERDPSTRSSRCARCGLVVDDRAVERDHCAHWYTPCVDRLTYHHDVRMLDSETPIGLPTAPQPPIVSTLGLVGTGVVG